MQRSFVFLGTLIAFGLVVAGCGNGTKTPNYGGVPVFTPIPSAPTVNWTIGTTAGNGGFTLPPAGAATVTVNGAPPFAPIIVGNCATIVNGAANGSNFTVVPTGNASFCALVVTDGNSQAQGFALSPSSPPRTFLTVSSASGSTPPGTTLSLRVGATATYTVSETLVGSPFGAPYGAATYGNCASIASSANAFTITAARPGACTVVFTDSVGQAVPLNIYAS